MELDAQANAKLELPNDGNVWRVFIQCMMQLKHANMDVK